MVERETVSSNAAERRREGGPVTSRTSLGCETFEDWMYYTMELETILELADHGADAGWPGLCYYNETSALYERYEKEIWEALHEDSADEGFWRNIIDLVGSFKGAKEVASDAGFRNLLVYYMAERTAHAIADSQ